VDDFIWFLIIIAGASIFERMMKSARKKQQEQGRVSQYEEGEGEEEAEGQHERAPTSIQEILAEQLGLNMERRPRVLPPPESAEPETATATAVAPPGVRTVVHPSSPKDVQPEQSPAERAAEYAQRRREAATKRAADRRREHQLPSRRTDLPERLSLEERALLERGAPKTLERPRRPEDHDRFHQRYDVPKPVSSHTEFHKRYVQQAETVKKRRRVGVALPARPEWSAVKKAIVWAEVLGPPKGMS